MSITPSIGWKQNVTQSVLLGGAFWDAGAHAFIHCGVNAGGGDIDNPRVHGVRRIGGREVGDMSVPNGWPLALMGTTRVQKLTDSGMDAVPQITRLNLSVSRVGPVMPSVIPISRM
ncbi:hypothetical protein N9018_03995 [Rhodopirellula sp.]|nr:hypothetical protein [Rhodopirellula sp.]